MFIPKLKNGISTLKILMNEEDTARQEQKHYHTKESKKALDSTRLQVSKRVYPKAVLWLDEVGRGDVALVGQKAANLGSLHNIVTVPRGFCLTTEIFRQFMKTNGIWDLVIKYLVQKSPRTLADIENISQALTNKIRDGNLSERYETEILQMCQHLRTNPIVVRSSATSEDLARASFAGQYSSYLNVSREDLLRYAKLCVASLYSVRGIHYRKQRAIPEDSVNFAILVQEIVDATVAGIMFTVNPVTRNHNEMVIEATYGLGELVASGRVTPDYYAVDKPQLIVKERKTHPKREAMYVIMGTGTVIENVPTSVQKKNSLSDDQIVQLSLLGLVIEQYFSSPQDVEWAIDKSGRIFVLQSRQITNL